MKFIYNSGQRPLDGYTIKRGIGRGGFGEVYYAVSDGGKEVALKLVQGQQQDVELRGMAQCLNIKHPNLVSLYDIRKDGQGDHWIVMEYVGGEPLSVILARFPHGIAKDQSHQWFLSLTRAVGYLHDHGIVHRDLKPANIFIENGLVKVGDYGLCKFISGSQRNAQTQSVGTVHYMAPEISTGNYNKQIDTYACGIMLYEMLTGHVPFDGESAGEILMKHLTTPPDLSKLPPEYVTIVGKALAKNPAHRYTAIAEMARHVEAIGRPGPAISQRPAMGIPVSKAELGLPPTPKQPKIETPPPKSIPKPAEPIPTVLPAVTMRTQLAELSGSMAMAAVLTAVFTALWVAFSHGASNIEIGQEFYLILATCWSVLVPAKMWSDRKGDSWARRVAMMVFGMVIGSGMLWLDGWKIGPHMGDLASASRWGDTLPASFQSHSRIPEFAQSVCYFSLAFFVLRWWKLADRRRAHRFSFAPLLAVGFWSILLMMIWQEPWRGPLVLTSAAAIIQLVSPWEPAPPPVAKRVRLRYA